MKEKFRFVMFVTFVIVLGLFFVAQKTFSLAPEKMSMPSAAIPTQCQIIAQHLVDYVDDYQGRLIAFQLASNKSRWERKGHFSLAEGYLVEFDPEQQSDIAYMFPDNGKSIFQPAPFYVMKGFVDSEPGSLPSGSSFPTERRDDIYLHLTENGNVTVVLRTWGDGGIPLENMYCYSDAFGYYMSGIMREGNGTRAISLVMRKVDL